MCFIIAKKLTMWYNSIIMMYDDIERGKKFMRRTKIICTLGPATDVTDVLKDMIKAGMNVARCNFSHADHAEHLVRMELVRKIRKELDMPVGIMLDTKGPEIRIKTFKDEAFVDGKINLVEGKTFTLTTRDLEGTNEIVTITYTNLPNDVIVGTKILIDDGLIAFEVTEIKDTDIICTVLNSGKLSNRKSLNVPGAKISMPYISDKDRADIIFGCKQKVDYIAASFVRTAKDVLDLKEILNAHDGNDIQIIAKIENMEGVLNIDEILKEVDGVMVARGDMGVEIDFAELPRIQKMLIKKCIASGKRVITATQMLESMAINPRPTRAEVSDVANAVYDGTSCVMLSGESSVGKYPVETVATMAKIAKRAEDAIDYRGRRATRREFKEFDEISDGIISSAIAHATCTTSEDLDSKAIVAFTMSGSTAKFISSYRPCTPILAATPSERAYHQMSMSWGVTPIMAATYTTDEELMAEAKKCALASGLCSKGDVFTVSTGMPFGKTGATNNIRVCKID